MKVKWASLQSVTPQALNLDLCPIKLGEAVAASMSFPPVIGPITFKVEGEDRYWHAGDGGLSDNMGLESLATVALNALQQNSGPSGTPHCVRQFFPLPGGVRSAGSFSRGVYII